jgi:hypothetical protein
MSSNIYIPHEPISPETMFCAILKLMHEADYDMQQRITYKVPELSMLIELLSYYNTGSGLIPFDYVSVYNVKESKFEIKEGGLTKKALATYLADYIIKYLSEAESLAREGNMVNKPLPGESICVESRKSEIRNALEESSSYEALVEAHDKIRLFYIEPAQYIMLSFTVLKGIFSSLRFPGYEIGSRINSGDFARIWEYHLCDTEYYEVLYMQYPELRARRYGDGDIAAFDQSLLYNILMATGIFLGTYYKYDDYMDSLMVSDVVFRLCCKFLYMVSMDTVKYVVGMMFSGKLETSDGDTLYQNIVFMLWTIHLLEKYKDHIKYHLLQVAISFKLLTRSFSGDDLLQGWPVALEELFDAGLPGYVEFCKTLGLTFKFWHVLPLYGEVRYISVKSIWKLESQQEGVSFLKNQVCRVYEDGIFVGSYPYRSFEDLIFRLGNSDKANAYLDTIYAKVLSLAYLSVGNREAYQYFQIFFQFYKKMNGGFKIDRDVLRSVFKGSGALYNLFNEENAFDLDEFPSLEFLRDKHDSGQVRMRMMPMDFETYMSNPVFF